MTIDADQLALAEHRHAEHVASAADLARRRPSWFGFRQHVGDVDRLCLADGTPDAIVAGPSRCGCAFMSSRNCGRMSACATCTDASSVVSDR